MASVNFSFRKMIKHYIRFNKKSFEDCISDNLFVTSAVWNDNAAEIRYVRENKNSDGNAEICDTELLLESAEALFNDIENGNVRDHIISIENSVKLIANIHQALEMIFNPSVWEYTYDVEKYVNSAIVGMKLLDITHNKSFLRKIELGMKDSDEDSGASLFMSRAFCKFRMYDEYHWPARVFRLNNRSAVLSQIDAVLRPDEDLNYNSAFEKGYDQALREYNETRKWPIGLSCPRIEYLEEGEEKVTFFEPLFGQDIPSKIANGTITNLFFPPKEKGKLEGLMAGVLERISSIEDSGTMQELVKQYARTIAGSLYLLSLANNPDEDPNFNSLQEKHPELSKIIEIEIEKYKN